MILVFAYLLFCRFFKYAFDLSLIRIEDKIDRYFDEEGTMLINWYWIVYGAVGAYVLVDLEASVVNSMVY